jgi:hypothetical protein
MVGDPGAWIIIDSYNNFFGGSGQLFELEEHGVEYVFSDKDMEDIGAEDQGHVEITVSDPNTPVGLEQTKQRRSYMEQINKSRFASGQVPKASAQQLRGNLKEKEKKTEKFSRIANKAIRRACRFGIGMVATETAPAHLALQPRRRGISVRKG